MKHLKTYENLNEPKINDWVYAIPNENRALSKEWKIWMRTHLGQIINITNFIYSYQVKYETNSGEEIIRVQRDEIVEFSENKEDLEYLIQARKYNL